MPIKSLKPITPGQRGRTVNGFDAITTDSPEKSLLVPYKKTGGRNSQGKMTMKYRGGGHKKKYRLIDFKRDRKDENAEVLSIEYDPNRSAFIALTKFDDGEKRYIIAPKGLKVGLDENVQPLNTKTSSLSLLLRSFTCKYAVISGLSSNSEFLHFKALIEML